MIVSSSTSAVYVNVDPREEMIDQLVVQNQTMLQELDKASAAFENHKAEQAQLISTLARSNEELTAALIAAEARNKELTQIHERALKALNDKQEYLSEIARRETDKILELCTTLETCQKNLPLCDELNFWKGVLVQHGNLTGCNALGRTGSLTQIIAETLGEIDKAYRDRANPDGYLPGGKILSTESIQNIESIKGRVKSIQSVNERK